MLIKRLIKCLSILGLMISSFLIFLVVPTLGQENVLMERSGVGLHYITWKLDLTAGQRIKLDASCSDASGTGITGYIHEFHVDLWGSSYNYFSCFDVDTIFTVPYTGEYDVFFHVHTDAVLPDGSQDYSRFFFNYDVRITDADTVVTTPEVTDEPTETPEVTDEPTATPEVTDEPTATPEVTTEPTDEPTATPEVTTEPTDEPTATPEVTTEPTDEPTVTPEPTDEPTDEPTVTPEPTDEPTDEPTATPEVTTEPTDEPTATPEVTGEPTDDPEVTDEPTRKPISRPAATATPLPPRPAPPPDDRLNWNYGDLTAVIYRGRDDFGGPSLVIYAVNETGRGYLLCTVNKADLGDHAETTPESNVFIKRCGTNVNIYVLTTGEIQVNIVEANKEFITMVESLAAREVRHYMIEA